MIVRLTSVSGLVPLTKDIHLDKEGCPLLAYSVEKLG